MTRGDDPLPAEELRQIWHPHYSTRSKPQTPPLAGAFDAPLVGCCINAEWMSHILGSTAILDWPDMWKGTPDAIQHALDQITRIQDAMTCPCGCTGISIINKTITESFRFQLRLEFEANGLIGVAPDMPDTAFDEDSGDDFGEAEIRQLALCWACTDYVNTILGAAEQTAVDIGLEVFGALVIPAFALGPIAGLAFVSGVITLTATVLGVFREESTREDIACCMRDNLTGQAITQANFEVSLVGCGFTFPSIKDTVRELVEETFNDQGNFLSFVKSLGAYHGAGDLLSACPCDPMVETCNFKIDECGWVPQGGGPGLLAEYDEGLGWDNAPGGAVNHIIAIFRDLAVDTSFSLIKIYNVNTLGADDLIYSFKLWDSDVVLLSSDSIQVPSSQTSHQFTFAQVDDVRFIEIRISRTGLELDFPGHLTAVQVIADPPPFPEQ